MTSRNETLSERDVARLRRAALVEIVDDGPIAHDELPARARREAAFVRHHDDGEALFTDEALAFMKKNTPGMCSKMARTKPLQSKPVSLVLPPRR